MRTILQPEWLIDGIGADLQSGQSVIIENDQITAVEPTSQISTSSSDQVFRLDGQTLIPGLINNHVHLVLPGDNTAFVPWIDLQSDASLALTAAHNIAKSLSAGVTTVRDCGGRREVVLDVRAAQLAGKMQGSRIISCGWTLTIEGGHTRQFGGEVTGEDAIRRMVRHVISKGADYVKVMASGGGTPGTYPQYPAFTRDELTVMADEAHMLGRKLCAHCIAAESIANAIDAGVDLIEHASFYGPDLIPSYEPELGKRLADSGIPVTPTLAVNRDLVDLTDPSDPDHDQWKRRQEAQREIVRNLHELGVPLLAGSDAGWRATAFEHFWKEVDELVECGLSSIEAIHAATSAVSNALGSGNEFGAVKAGQRADLVAVSGNPVNDIRALLQVQMVIQAGNLIVSGPPLPAPARA